ncbi:hypothetical protein N3T10_004012 [Escherichia coli]|nr:hypothetical protein [Escherichia coli]EJT7589085.1 hypothetical protein [Escherichia coli]HAH1301826.1 hypothetical protein [Escherichia coli]HDD8373809.1 hypothetical protein [Escherichia coli]
MIKLNPILRVTVFREKNSGDVPAGAEINDTGELDFPVDVADGATIRVLFLPVIDCFTFILSDKKPSEVIKTRILLISSLPTSRAENPLCCLKLS